MTYEPEKPDKKFKVDPNKFRHNIEYNDYINRKFMEANDDDDDDFGDDDEEEAEEKEEL